MQKTNATPLSSVRGQIKQLLVTLPIAPDEYVNEYYEEIQAAFAQQQVIRYRNYEPPRHPNKPHLRPSLDEMDLKEQLHAIIDNREVLTFFGKEDFYQQYVGDLIDCLKLGTPISNTEWAQDPFCVLKDQHGGTIFLQPLFSKRYMDKFISLILASENEFDALVKPTQLMLEGGNILADANYLILGKDLLAQNVMQVLEAGQQAVSDREIIERLEAHFRTQFGVEHLIWMGFTRAQENWLRKGAMTYQPAFHADLFLTLGARDANQRQTVFLGSPSLALELLRGQVDERLLRIRPAAIAHFEEIETFWENYESERQPGMPTFRIVKIPLFIYHEVIYSYNNCLVEAFDAQLIAYLPTYQVSPKDDRYERLNPVFSILEAYTQDVLENHGFTAVNWIGPARFFRKLALMQGSLHCITKVLQRSPVVD